MNKKWFDEPMAVYDLETTGKNAEEDKIVEVAILHYTKGELEKSYVKLINPERSIPEEAKKVSGISDEDVISAETFNMVANDIIEWLKGRIHVAYNLPFDRGFFKAEIQRAGLIFPEEAGIDPLIFTRGIFKKGSKKLSIIAEKLGIQLKEAHRAKADAETAARILFALKEQLPADLNELLTLQAQWEKQQQVERAMWRKDDEQIKGESVNDTQLPALGPAYIYGNETDPLKAMFLDLAGSGGRKM